MPFLTSVVTQLKQYKSGKFYSDAFRGDLSWNGHETNNLLRNGGTSKEGYPMFDDVAMAVGADDDKDARGLGFGDIDGDGDLDILICCNQGGRVDPSAPVILRNDVGQTRNRIVVDLEGVVSNRDGVGAQVIIRCDSGKGKPIQMLRHVTAGFGYASQSSDKLYFGLDQHDSIRELTVRWPSGKKHQFENLAPNQSVSISEDGTISTRPLKVDRMMDQRLTLLP